MRERVYCHNLFMQYMRFPNQYIRGGLQKMRQLYNKLQILVGYKMKQPDYEFKAGCEWVSVTHDFVLSLLETRMKFSRCISMLIVLMKFTNKHSLITRNSEIAFTM